jgi:hypothetical protein
LYVLAENVTGHLYIHMTIFRLYFIANAATANCILCCNMLLMYDQSRLLSNMSCKPFWSLAMDMSCNLYKLHFFQKIFHSNMYKLLWISVHVISFGSGKLCQMYLFSDFSCDQFLLPGNMYFFQNCINCMNWYMCFSGWHC